MPADPILVLYMHLMSIFFTSPSGDATADAEIASVLGVPSLPYTSNNTDAQTLLPAGWSWSRTANGTICCVRTADSQSTGDHTDGDGNVVPLPNSLAHCLAAVEAYFIEDTTIS
jgi:hypothetical protein